MQSEHSQKRQLASRNPPALPALPREGGGTGIRTAWPSVWLRGLGERGVLRATLRSRGLKIAGAIAAALAVVLIGVNFFLSTDWVEA